MFRNVYIAIGLVLVVGYGWWTFTGRELGASRRDPVPKKVPYSSSHSSSRSRSGYFGYSSGGWGK